jgi:hypothetical protein
MKAGRAILCVVGFLAVVVMVLPSLALGSGTTPSPNPNPSSADGLAAIGAASKTTNAYSEVIKFWYNFTPSKDVGGELPWQLQNYVQVLGDNFNSPLTLVTGTTWINNTEDCTASTTPCNGYYACNGKNSQTFSDVPSTYTFSNPCLRFYINWSKLNTHGIQPDFKITRLLMYTYFQSESWHAQGRNALLYANVTSIGYNVLFGTIATPSFYTSMDLVWYVPYPAGNWVTASTTFTWVDTGRVFNQSLYAILATAFMVEWQGYPSGATSQTNHYLFSLLSNGAGPPPTNTNNTTVNQSIPRPPPQNIEVGEIALAMGNLSTTSSGFESSVIWENLFSYNFTGTFYLEASWMATATNITLLANGQPLAAFQYVAGPTSILIFPGLLQVNSQAQIIFTATFQQVKSFSIFAPLFYFNGVAVTVADILAVFVVATFVGIAYVKLEPGRRQQWGPVADTITGVILFAIFIGAVFYI